MNIKDLVTEKLRATKGSLTSDQFAVLKAIYKNWEKGEHITQQQIADQEPKLGCHPVHEKQRTRESTLRHIRQIIRDLRIDHSIPILSDAKGYWLPQDMAEVQEYITRMENVARAQAAAWFETYRAVKQSMNITSTFFDNLKI